MNLLGFPSCIGECHTVFFIPFKHELSTNKHIFTLFSHKMHIFTFYRLLLLFIFASQYVNK
mgnify:CR=1 FL=1